MIHARKLWQEHHVAAEEVLAGAQATPLQQATILFIAYYCYKLSSAEADERLHAIPKAPGLLSVLQDTGHKFRKTIEALTDAFPEDVLSALSACWPVDENPRPGRKLLPPEVDRLALGLLGIETGDTLIDLWGHGSSALLAAAGGEAAHTNFYSLEQDSTSYLLGFLRSRCLGDRVQTLPVNCLYTPLPPALRPSKLYLDATGEAASEVIHEQGRSIRQELSQYMNQQELLSPPAGEGEAALQEVFKNLQIANAVMLQEKQDKCRTLIICESGRLTEEALSGRGIPGGQLELCARLPEGLAPGLTTELDLLLLDSKGFSETRVVDVSNLGSKINGFTKLSDADLEKILLLCKANKLPLSRAKITSRRESQPVPARQEEKKSAPLPGEKELPKKDTALETPQEAAKPVAEAKPEPPKAVQTVPQPGAADPAGEAQAAGAEKHLPAGKPSPAATCPLKELLKKVQRGPALTNSKLLPLRSETPASCRYLNLKDIADGLLSEDMDSLREMPEKYRGYCLEPGDVVLTKTTPFKAACFDSEELTGLTILPGGNIYRLEPDQAKILPGYLTLYLQSPQGQEQLLRHAKGKSSVLIISMQELLELDIPLPSLEEQATLAMKYRRFRKRLLETQRRVEEIRQKMQELL